MSQAQYCKNMLNKMVAKEQLKDKYKKGSFFKYRFFFLVNLPQKPENLPIIFYHSWVWKLWH